jgi:hypothetical protein
MTPATEEKRNQLKLFIDRVLESEPAVQGVIGIGSMATGHMHPDSDIDAVIFLDPLELYIAPAEAIWRPETGSFHSILEDGVRGIRFDFTRLAWQQWSDPEFEWPENLRAELSAGWIAYDPSGKARRLIARGTVYPEALRLARLDEALVLLDQLLNWDAPHEIWDTLGPPIAHDRLEAAYVYLVQALFAYNRRWHSWRSREMQTLLALPWLPEAFASQVLTTANAPDLDYAGYVARRDRLRALFDGLLARLVAAGDYSATPIDQAFIRKHEEPGRSWNIDEWNKFHQARSIPHNGKPEVTP